MLLSFDIVKGDVVVTLVFAVVLLPLSVKLCAVEFVAYTLVAKCQTGGDAANAGVETPPPEVKLG